MVCWKCNNNRNSQTTAQTKALEHQLNGESYTELDLTELDNLKCHIMIGCLKIKGISINERDNLSKVASLTETWSNL